MTILFFNYFLADAARIRASFDELKSLNDSFKCLYQGKSEQNLGVAAPYIFKFPYSPEFSDYTLKKGWGDSWGVFVAAEDNIEKVHHHFRKFLIVKTEEGKELYFRFYDPRVLRIFLPTCDEEQLKEFFGPVQKFICEDEDPAFALLFSFDGRQLLIERVAAETIFSATKQIQEDEALTATANDPVREQKKPPRKFFY